MSAPNQEAPETATEMQSHLLEDGTIQLVFGSSSARKLRVDISKEMAHEHGFRITTLAARAYASEGNPQPDIPFDTKNTLVLSMLGNSSGGHLILRFLTPLGVFLTTSIGPELCATLASQLNGSLAQMPKPPSHWQRPGLPVSQLKGQTKADDTITYFGQDYPREIVEIMGVLIIRSNLLESALIRLLQAVTDLDSDRAEAIFFSIQNNRGRIDLIRNISSVSNINTSINAQISELLDKAKSLSMHRNLLVHGEWSFKADKFIVKERKPLPSYKSQDPIASYKSILSLSSGMHDLSVAIDLLLPNIARKTATTAE